LISNMTAISGILNGHVNVRKSGFDYTDIVKGDGEFFLKPTMCQSG